MTTAEIVAQRLYNQRLNQARLDRPEDVVAWMGAVQAQDYAGAQWALSLRMHRAAHAAIEQAFSDGLILRTHVMRPTWHFVAPADIRWLLALTAPRVHAAMAYNYRTLDLDAATFLRSDVALAQALEGGKQGTRAELVAVLAQAGIATEGLRLGHLLIHAELEGVICSGARRGKQFTYARLDERAPQSKSLVRDEALAELTKRYFASHGPATAQDFAWWSGLTQADVKAGLNLVQPELDREQFEGRTYWRFPSTTAGTPTTAGAALSSAALLPAYDEYTVAYKDRSAILDPTVVQQVGSAVIDKVFVVDGQAIGNWRRILTKDAVIVECTPFGPWRATHQDAFVLAAQRYGEFLELPVLFP